MRYILIAFLLLSAPALADDSKEKKAKAESKKEDLKEKETSKDEPGPKEANGQENPLPKILDLMKEVESRLNEATDEGVQQDQKKIVEAMKFGDKVSAALDDFIKKIEDEMSKSSKSDAPEIELKSQSKNQNESPQEKSEREKREKEKLEKEKKIAEQKKSGFAPKTGKPESKSGKTSNDGKGREQKNEQPNKLDPARAEGGNWGSLPSKLHEDALKARDGKVPERYREQIEKYRTSTSE